MEQLIKALKETNWVDFYQQHVTLSYLANGSTHVKIDGETMITIGTSTKGY